jgi:predicted aconitase with swiveling domain
MIRATVLNAAAAEGPVLALDEPLSFWGAFEPRSGVIIDAHHPQRGANAAGTVLLMHETRGSGSAPGAIAEAIRRGTAPTAIILAVADFNLAIGASVAHTLYGRSCAVLCVTPDELSSLRRMATLRVTAAGEITGESV